MFGMRAGSGAQTCPRGMTGGRLLTPPLRNVTKVLLSINMERENWTFYYLHCIYCIQSYFRQLIFSSFLTCKWFRSVLNSLRCSCVFKKRGYFGTLEFAHSLIRLLTTRMKEAKKIYFYSFEYYPMKFTEKYELHVILHRYLGYLLIFFNFPFRSTKHVIPKVQSFWLDNIIALYFIW